MSENSSLRSFFGKIFRPFAKAGSAFRRFLFPENSTDLPESSRRYLKILSAIVFSTTVVCLLAAAAYMVSAYSTLYVDRNKGINEMLLDAFSDFTYIVEMSVKSNPWANAASSYPPLAILILRPFALICSPALEHLSHRHVSSYKACAVMLKEPTFWVSVVLFTVLCAAAVFLLLQKYMKFVPGDFGRFFLALFFSAPFTYVIIRGNILFVGLIFTLMFLLWYDSENPVLREVALLSLAAAGAIKIYPLIFGVFLLRKKKWFASFRVAVYTVLLFLIPLYVIYPQPDAPLQFLKFTSNLGTFASRESRLAGFNNISVSGLLFKILSLFKKDLTSSDLLYRLPNYFSLFCVFAGAVVGSLLTEKRFYRTMLCFCAVALIPSVSYFYILAFAVLPLCEFLLNRDELPRRERLFYALGFGYLFLLPALAGMFYLPQSLIVITMFVLSVRASFTEGITRIKVKEAPVPAE